MNKNPDDLFFQFREYDIEIKNKIKSLDICNKKIFLYFSSFVSNKLSEIDKSKLNHLFDILNNLHLDENYIGYLTHPIRIAYSYANNLSTPSFDDISLALCHNIIELGFEEELKKFPNLISDEVWRKIRLLTIERSRSKDDSYLNYYYDNINKVPNLMLLKTLDKLDNTLWWVKLDHIKPYDSMVVKKYVCPRIITKNPFLSEYLLNLTDYVLDKNVRLNFKLN